MSGVRRALAASFLGASLPILLVNAVSRYRSWTAAHRAAFATIAFIAPTTADDIWEPAHFGAIAALRGSHEQIYWNGPTFAQDAATQILLLQQAVQSHVRGIIVAPVYSSALMVPVEQALRQGASVVVVGETIPLPPSSLLHFVLTDEEAAGRLLAARLASVLHGHGLVGIVGADPAPAGSFERMQAFQSALTATSPQIQIVARRQGANSQLEAEQRTRELLRASPQLQALVALTPEATAGAYSAMEEVVPGRRPLLLGAGQEYSSLYRLSQRQIDSLLVENTFQMGATAVHLLRNASTLKAGSPVLLQPLLITRDNMLQPALTPVLTHLSGAGL